MYNEYDKEIFFEKYAKMARSKEGLSAAGERRIRFPVCDVLKYHHTLT